MRSFIKKTCWFLSAFIFAGGLFLGGCYLGYALKCSFYIKNLHVPSNGAQNESTQLIGKEQADAIFSQKFSYLGEGRQCFAFESQDGKYVIKFFKAHHMKRQEWLKEGLLASLFKNKKQFKDHQDTKKHEWEKELTETAMRYQIAMENMPKETGLLMLHFNETNDLNKVLTVVSKKKLVTIVDLDHVSFILQEKATLTRDKISGFLQANNQNSAIESIVMLQDLLIKRTKKGISDERQCYGVNFGFVHEGAVQIDVGKISQNETFKSSPHVEIARLTHNLNEWVKKNYPEIYPQAKEQLEKHLAEKS